MCFKLLVSLAKVWWVGILFTPLNWKSTKPKINRYFEQTQPNLCEKNKTQTDQNGLGWSILAGLNFA